MNDRSRPEAAPESLLTTPQSVAAGTDNAGDARRRADRIRLLLNTITEQLDKVVRLIEQAREEGDHLALGYPSWTTYVATEFGELLTGLSRPNRRLAVGALDDLGMSTRAIASVVGTSPQTVSNDLVAVAGVQKWTPEVHDDREVEGRDDEVHDREVDVRPGGGHLAPVVGLDGKTYQRKPPRPPRRSGYPIQYRDALDGVRQAVAKLEKVQADDRFSRNRPGLQHHTALVCELTSRLAALALQLRPDISVREAIIPTTEAGGPVA